jgi:recombination protein RecA
MDRNKALKALGAAVEKVMGPGGQQTLADQAPLSVMSSGILTVDHALGTGGWARGSLYMTYGRPGSGKTALALMAIGDKMRRDPNSVSAWLDVEGSLLKDWVTAFGIDPARLYVYPVATTEETVDVFQRVLRTGVFDYVVVDSLGAVARNVEVEGKDGTGGDSTTSVYGGSSGLISRMVRIGNSELTRLKRATSAGDERVVPAVLLINQVRADTNSSYAGALTFSGGYALEHMISTIVRVQASGGAKDILMGTDTTGKQVKVGSLVNITTEKNKQAPSPRAASYQFCYQACPEFEFGVNTLRAIMDIAIPYGFIEQGGAWYTYDGQQWQGAPAFLEWLKEHPEAQDDLRTKVLSVVRKELVDSEIHDEA